MITRVPEINDSVDHAYYGSGLVTRVWHNLNEVRVEFQDGHCADLTYGENLGDGTETLGIMANIKPGVVVRVFGGDIVVVRKVRGGMVALQSLDGEIKGQAPVEVVEYVSESIDEYRKPCVETVTDDGEILHNGNPIGEEHDCTMPEDSIFDKYRCMDMKGRTGKVVAWSGADLKTLVRWDDGSDDTWECDADLIDITGCTKTVEDYSQPSHGRRIASIELSILALQRMVRLADRSTSDYVRNVTNGVIQDLYRSIHADSMTPQITWRR